MVGKRSGSFELSLFRNGAYDGFLFDFSKTSQLFKDQIGTAVSVDADPVGLAIDSHSLGGRTLTQVLASQPAIFADDFSTYADSTALQAAWLAGGTSPLVTLGAAPSRMRIENGAAAVAFASRTFTTVPGRICRAIGNVIAKGANTARMLAGTTANNGGLGLYQASAIGLFSLWFIPTGVSTFFTGTTNSATLGHFVEADDLEIKEIPGRPALQTTTTARPFWKTPNFLRPDGTDDNLLTGFVCAAAGNSAVAKVKVPASLAATQIVMGTSGSATARFFVGFNTSGQLVGGVGTDDATVVLHASDYRGLTGVLALVEDGTNWFLYWNGAQVATGARNGAPSTTIPWRLFAQNNNGTAGSFAAIDTYRMLGINRALTPPEVAILAAAWS